MRTRSPQNTERALPQWQCASAQTIATYRHGKVEVGGDEWSSQHSGVGHEMFNLTLHWPSPESRAEWGGGCNVSN